MPSVAVYVTWKQLGFFILLYLAALQNVPKELYEAASMDGASWWHRLWAVTVPGVRTVTTLITLLAIIVGANLFTEPYLLTAGGGPSGKSASPVLLMYQTGIEQNHPDFGPRGPPGPLGTGGRRRPTVAAKAPGMTPATRTEDESTVAPDDVVEDEPRTPRGWWRLALLLVGALVFVFPFYYMIVGSLQKTQNQSLSGALPQPGNLTLHNYSEVNAALDLGRALINSGIFTGGVLLATVIFGVLAGYALAQLHFRGRSLLFVMMLLLLMVPFQLLIIPLYVLIVRNYGLGNSYLGMIAPFAINSTAVFIFRQYFMQLPKELFDAARIDGANELRILTRVALPLVRPALLTAMLLTFIGPWNEYLWPFLITKQQRMEPLAVALANYMNTVQSTVANPFGTILAGAFVLAVPAVVLFLAFQRYFIAPNIGSAVKG